MASNSEYEQRISFKKDKLFKIVMFDTSNGEELNAQNVLNKLIIENNLKEKFRKSFMDSVISGEERIYIENLKTK